MVYNSLVHIKFVPSSQRTEEVEVLSITDFRIVVVLPEEKRQKSSMLTLKHSMMDTQKEDIKFSNKIKCI